MTDSATESALAAVRAMLYGIDGVRLAIAHGSRIVGEPDRDSDLDLFIVFEGDAEERRDLLGRLFELELGGISLDPHVQLLASVSEGSCRFHRLVLTRGRVLVGDPELVFGREHLQALSAALSSRDAAHLYGLNKRDVARRQVEMAETWIGYATEAAADRALGSFAGGAVEYLLGAAASMVEALGLARGGVKPRGTGAELIALGLNWLDLPDIDLPTDATALMDRRWDWRELGELTWNDVAGLRPRIAVFVAAAEKELERLLR